MAIRTSSDSSPARAMIRPKGSATNELPQNSRPPVDGPFVADPVDGCHVHPVGDGMGSLHRFPGARLGGAKLRFLCRVPTDRRGIEEDARALESCQPGGFGVPLVPANQGADSGIRRVKCLKSKVAGSEIILLVIEGVVRDVHLAIASAERSVRVDHDRRIVV